MTLYHPIIAAAATISAIPIALMAICIEIRSEISTRMK